MSLKCVVVGDTLAGKSELCSMYQPNKNPIVIEGVVQKLELADETGKVEFGFKNKLNLFFHRS